MHENTMLLDPSASIYLAVCLSGTRYKNFSYLYDKYTLEFIVGVLNFYNSFNNPMHVF